ncbi:HpcH/HpaI aldolase/citrate lyase family protein [Colletotrichum scovillei]|uniref:HpcH/HpaI aldolase/citrate lyase family protein n=1 Tax=Colletotrichum scovillei TaxID=1209932 RepID=A0A9P7UA92_9PEZI|nr:HpcH/HpaI aldolase/citrate lyase family protein [Colletotrichum scovillei]KAG7065382.1 HpcH/HpaI aldolase/citrate lyase family protein [Colletotrichum scovillei]KAG7067985.1 HpcH/HpaI aldolase/citrate lyase family protein [Colletotrichum scovillei]
MIDLANDDRRQLDQEPTHVYVVDQGSENHMRRHRTTATKQIQSSVMDVSGKTKLRESLERAKGGKGPSIGQWLEFPGYSLARTVAPLGEDWVLIDTEHGNIDDSQMYLQEQAEAIVRACKYPSSRWPQGLRGAGAMFAPAAFNQTGREYLLTANDNVMVCVQIENRKAVENVEEIAAVDGIDMLFVGPNDLASSMGYVAFDHASISEVQEASARVLKAGLDAGKYVGHFALSADAAALKYERGFHFVNCGADIVAITAWMSGEMAKLKDLVAAMGKQRSEMQQKMDRKQGNDDSENKLPSTQSNIGYS